MGGVKTATDPMVIHYRRRLVNAANIVKELRKQSFESSAIPLEVSPLLTSVEELLIEAYQLLPDE